MVTTALPRAGYTVPEVEKLLGIAPKTGYRLVNTGRLQAFNGLDGKLRVSEIELWMYVRYVHEKDVTNS